MSADSQTRILSPGPISSHVLAAFAVASGDHNPIHLDPEAARSAGWDDVVAHGMLSMAYLGRLLTDASPQESIRSFRVRFVAVTPLHADPIFAARVSGTESEQSIVELSASLSNGATTLVGRAVIDG